MTAITNLLLFLGNHFYFVLIGCAELILAVVLLGILPRRQSVSPRAKLRSTGAERMLIPELARRSDNVCVALRRQDLMPVIAAGNIENILGIKLDALQDDLSLLLDCLDERQAGLAFWQNYRDWNGKTPLQTDLPFKGGEWLRVAVQRSLDQDYDLFFFSRRTEEHNQMQSYEQRLAKAESASQFKTSFLFRMSHEIRTPMNGITGMLTLAESKLPADHPAMQYLTQADELSEHLLSLINDILDMSRIEAGKVELEQRPFNLHAFGDKLYDMFAKTLENKHIAFRIDYDALTVDWVSGDELRIGQILINFLSNAVKFTSAGEVIVTVRQMLLRDGRVDLMFRVHDTGIGMQPEFISRIFRPFEQEDASTTRRFGGTGLGMAISDQLVKLMGGQIVVESLPGVGSDFTVFLSLPVAEAPAESQAPQSAAAAEAAPQHDPAFTCRILMAEDNRVNAMIAEELLRAKGAEIDVAENGKLAVERFCSQPEGYYDVILMDIQMPVMDGREAARTIRKLSRKDAATIPIFALSADAFVEDERLSRESGMNGHLTKPIDFDALWRTLQDTLRTERSANE